MAKGITYEYLSLITFAFSLTTTNAAHILGIFPLAGRSHFSCNHAILKSLHAAGHNVTMLTPFPKKNVENFTYIDSSGEDTFIFINHSDLDDFTDMSLSYLIDYGSHLNLKYCPNVMKLPVIQEALSSSRKLYDVLLAEFMTDIYCYLPIAEKLNIPVIATVTTRSLKRADNAIGVPNNPAVVPYELGHSDVEMNFLERIENLWYHLVVDYYHTIMTWEVDKFYRKYFAQDLLYKKEISLMFYNGHASLLPRAFVPNAVEIGGIHVTPAKPLPKDLQKFIDEAPHGVILFTFGSIVRSSSMSMEKRRAFLNAFSSIPQRVIWKFEESIENLPKNIMISSWLPQRDILEHKNVIAFITHCGLSGVYEAVTTGTPVVTIPLFADQDSNAAILRHRKVGVPLELKTVTKEKILTALNAIINDTSYYERMQELSRALNDRPMTPQQSVVYWTEYVIRNNGTPYLKAIGTDMPLYKFLMLDIIALGIVFLIFTVIVFYYLVSTIILSKYTFTKTAKSSIKCT